MERKIVPDNFWDLTKIEKGTILHDVVRDGYRLVIIRGPMAWCCYIGVPLDSPLAHLSYEDEAMSNFACHGGLTYAGVGDDIYRPAGWFYFGWDYGHAGDWSPTYEEVEHLSKRLGESLSSIFSDGTKWKFSEIKADLEAGFEQMKRLCEGLPKPRTASAFKSLPLVRNGHKRLIRCSE